jgi:hypothetical protein
MNPAMTLLLRSPLHGPISKRLLLLTFTGHKSGKQFTTPLSYEREGDDTLIVITRRPWWKNFQGGSPVKVRLQGKTRDAVATAVTDIKTVADYIRRSLARDESEFNARRFGVTRMPGQGPSQAALEASAQDQHMIQIELKD